jgi:pyridoxal phosphate enzyme (YggS family)
MNDLSKAIAERYARVREEISLAARRAGRREDSVRLIVVTKAQPMEVIRAAIDAGIRLLGENYPEEAAEKMDTFKDAKDVRWHMIGHIQSRKARLVAERFDFVHSVDSLKVARRLSRFAVEYTRTLPILLEFNVGGEDSKYGWRASDETWLPDIEEILSLPGLSPRGLMTMPPLFDDAEQSRPYFQALRKLRDSLASRFPQVSWDELSMGTSADFRVAVEEGATFVRVGRAIVGPRMR